MTTETLIFQNSYHEVLAKMVINLPENRILESDNDNKKIIEKCKLTGVILNKYDWPELDDIKYCLI